MLSKRDPWKQWHWFWTSTSNVWSYYFFRAYCFLYFFLMIRTLTKKSHNPLIFVSTVQTVLYQDLMKPRECVRNLILRVHMAAIAAAVAGARAWARRDDRHRRVLSFIRPARPRSYLDFPKKSIFLSDLLTYLSSSEWGKLGTSI